MFLDVCKIWGIGSSDVLERHEIIIFACHLEFYWDLNCLLRLFLLHACFGTKQKNAISIYNKICFPYYFPGSLFIFKSLHRRITCSLCNGKYDSYFFHNLSNTISLLIFECRNIHINFVVFIINIDLSSPTGILHVKVLALKT